MDEYVNNESEICEVLINTLDRFYQCLPTSLIISPNGSMTVKQLINENFPESTDKNNFYYSYLKFIEFVQFLGKNL